MELRRERRCIVVLTVVGDGLLQHLSAMEAHRPLPPRVSADGAPEPRTSRLMIRTYSGNS